jgi:hypothetical protein
LFKRKSAKISENQFKRIGRQSAKIKLFALFAILAVLGLKGGFSKRLLFLDPFRRGVVSLGKDRWLPR